MGMNYNEMFFLLSEDNSEELQERGRRMAREISFISIFFQPIEDQSVWENCALIICEKSDAELEHYQYEMLCWLQDPNWPGFFKIYNRLIVMDANLLATIYLYTINRAKLLADETWMDYISGLIVNRKLYNLLPSDIRILMDSHYKNYWG